MLPYSPLHHMLVADFGGPLVATSGNISGEPVLDRQSDGRNASGRDRRWLSSPRPPDRPPGRRSGLSRHRRQGAADRLGRGNAPLEIDLPWSLPHPMLALGGHLKNTIALGWGNRAVISPHLGDMDTRRGLDIAGAGRGRPAIALRRRRAGSALRCAPGLRHNSHCRHAGSADEAHLSSRGPRLGARRRICAPPKTGWCSPGTAPASAATARSGAARRCLGGRAGGDAWQPCGRSRSSAASVPRASRGEARLLCAGRPDASGAPARRDTAMLRHAWSRKLNCPRTSSIGRLFDGAAALLGLVSHATYEGQAPSRLEAISSRTAEPIDVALVSSGRRNLGPTGPRSSIAPRRTLRASGRAAMFHATLAELLLAQARAIRARARRQAPRSHRRRVPEPCAVRS